MRARSYEVIIAGGGPAGSACAAAILGRRPDLAGRVLVLERARHPRAKPCGGGLTGHVAAALSALGLRLQVPSAPAAHAEVVFGDVTRTVRLGQPVHVVRREEFDHSLLQQAQERGAEVWQGAALQGFRVTDDAVEVALRTGSGEDPVTLRAQVLIGADGAGSLVRKQLCGHREGHSPHPLRLFRAEIDREARSAAVIDREARSAAVIDREARSAAVIDDRGAARFAMEAQPGVERMVYDFTPMAQGLRGYLWLFPVPGGLLNVGVMHAAGPRAPALSGAALATLCQEQLRRHGVTLQKGTLRGWPAWGYHPRSPLSAPRVCLVGDAAGIDGLTGEGIAVALEQGLVAAAAICEGLERRDLELRDYGRRLRRAPVGRELALDRVLSWVLYDHPLGRQAPSGGGHVAGWQRWLGMVLFDADLLDLYAARVAGTLVLAEHKLRLAQVLGRHLLRAGDRRARLLRALASAAGPR